MHRLVKPAVVAAVAVLWLGAAPSASATVFAAWEVDGVSLGDTLNVRKYPAGTSQKQAAYPNGTPLQMTGRCTGGVNLFDLYGKPKEAQRQTVRFRWCEVWHDPARSGVYTTGWVYARYIRPM